MFRSRMLVLLSSALLLAASTVSAEGLKPYVMGEGIAGSIADAEAGVRSALVAAGFTVAGEYSPYTGAKIIIVTNDELKNHAAKSDFGGYGAVIRVALSEVDGAVQVAWVNPQYMVNIYRMTDGLAGVTESLKKALGGAETFGSKKGISAKKLRKYHYKVFMPYFDDPDELAEYADHAAAVAAVEKGLAAGSGGVTKVYRIDIPGKDEVVFGVALGEGKGSDEYVMGKINRMDQKHTAHLPYEMLVSGKTVYALGAKFRIAQSFPDLSMMGSGSFASIMSAPGATENALEAVAEAGK